MPARNHKNWTKKPDVEHVDSRIYSEWEIFNEEQDKIFSKCWIPVCHESELLNELDYRSTSIAGKQVIVIKEKENIHAFKLNLYLGVAGTLSGQMHRAIFSQCQELPCEVKHGGTVWTTLNTDIAESVEEWTAGAFDCLGEAIDTEPLEVFHYHKAIIDSNYKLWHDTNSEFYHDYMHYFNRVTGFNDEYFARKCTGFKNGHVNVGSFEVQYGEFELGGSREELSFPGFPPNQWYMIDLFPGMNFNLRGSALRTDIVTPLGPNKVMIEFRGFGLKKDTPQERKTRIEHHNTIWGPFGRNLHEDLLGITGQGASMRPGTEPRNILHGRHEDDTIHDEIGMRHFYGEWSNWMGRDPANPMKAEEEIAA